MVNKEGGDVMDLRLKKDKVMRSDKRDSNPRPSAWEADALPTELLSHCYCKVKQ